MLEIIVWHLVGLIVGIICGASIANITRENAMLIAQAQVRELHELVRQLRIERICQSDDLDWLDESDTKC